MIIRSGFHRIEFEFQLFAFVRNTNKSSDNNNNLNRHCGATARYLHTGETFSNCWQSIENLCDWCATIHIYSEHDRNTAAAAHYPSMMTNTSTHVLPNRRISPLWLWFCPDNCDAPPPLEPHSASVLGMDLFNL